jgi:hypothetical protein
VRGLFQTFQTDGVQVARQARLEAARRHGRVVAHLEEGVDGGRPLERRPAGQQGVENGAQGVDVGGGAGVPAGGRLGRHVLGSAQDLAGARLVVRALEEPGQAEVRDLQPAGGGAEDVGGLEVAVDDAALVGRLHRPGQGLDPGGGLEGGLGPAGGVVGQGAAVEVLEGEIGLTLVLADLVDGDDIGVLQAGDGLRLRLEAGAADGLGEPAGQHHLEGHQAAQRLLPGLVDDAHAAAAQLLQDHIHADPLRHAGRGHHGSGNRRWRRIFGRETAAQGVDHRVGLAVEPFQAALAGRAGFEVGNERLKNDGGEVARSQGGEGGVRGAGTLQHGTAPE